jgi:hypothetical protein
MRKIAMSERWFGHGNFTRSVRFHRGALLVEIGEDLNETAFILTLLRQRWVSILDPEKGNAAALNCPDVPLAIFTKMRYNIVKI